MNDDTDFQKLDDQITIKMTREEAAGLLIAASLGAQALPPELRALAERGNRIIQASGASRQVVFRVLGEHQTKR